MHGILGSSHSMYLPRLAAEAALKRNGLIIPTAVNFNIFLDHVHLLGLMKALKSPPQRHINKPTEKMHGYTPTHKLKVLMDALTLTHGSRGDLGLYMKDSTTRI